MRESLNPDRVMAEVRSIHPSNIFASLLLSPDSSPDVCWKPRTPLTDSSRPHRMAKIPMEITSHDYEGSGSWTSPGQGGRTLCRDDRYITRNALCEVPARPQKQSFSL